MFFNTPNEEVGEDFTLLPEGQYRVMVIDSAYKTTKAGTGRYVAVALQILDGVHKSQRLFANFNIENPSEQAQQIGRQQFKRFLLAVGITQSLRSEQEFHKLAANKTLWVYVTQRTDDKGTRRNDVKRYMDAPDGSSQGAGDSSPSATRMAAGGNTRDPRDDIPF